MRSSIAGILPTLLLIPALSLAQSPVLRQDFEENVAGWATFGGGGKVTVTHEAANVKEGKGALQLDYEIKKDQISALLLPAGEGTLSKMKSLRFWVKADYATTLAIGIQEKDEGRYGAVLALPGGKWQQVELALSDFVLGDEANDPKDPDGKLDPEKAEAIFIMDLNNMFIQMGADSPIAKLFNLKAGPHNLYLDDFTVSETALPANSVKDAAGLRIDTFARPQITWIGVGGAQMQLSNGKPLEGKGLQAKYERSMDRFIGLAHPIHRGSLTGLSALSVEAASLNASTLIVQVEEVGGGKYKAVIEIPGGSMAKTTRLPFADFTPSDDSKDANNKLDLDQIKQIVIIDISSFSGAADQENTLWLGAVVAK